MLFGSHVSNVRQSVIRLPLFLQKHFAKNGNAIPALRVVDIESKVKGEFMNLGLYSSEEEHVILGIGKILIGKFA